jgi:hypothetical protein
MYSNYENPTQVEFENREGLADSGGSKAGSITASYAQLNQALGKPDYEGIGDNITTQFSVKAKFFDNSDNDFDSIKFTLYDWCYARDLNNPYQATEWNVGGYGYEAQEAADLLMQILNDPNYYLEDIAETNLTIETDMMVETYA